MSPAMLVAVGCVKGAPGVTTLAVGLAALWPRPGAVAVECDPSGGDLWARFGHHPEPGLSTLAAARWQGAVPAGCRQRLAVGADVVLAIPGDDAAASVYTLARHGALRQAAAAGTVIVDVGRVDRRSPSLRLAAVADHLLLLAGTDLAQQTQVGARLPWLVSTVEGRLWLVSAGGGPRHRGGLQRDFGLPVLGAVPRSRWGAAVLAGQVQVPNWRRLKLARAIGAIAAALAASDPAPDPAAGVRWMPATRAVPPVIGAPPVHREGAL